MKYILVFFAGLVCGGLILLQVQQVAYEAEADCLNSAQRTGTLTKQSCKQESNRLEKIT